MEKMKSGSAVILKRSFLILLTALLLASCQRKPADPLTKVTLHLTYIPNIQFAPVYVAIEKGYFEAEGLEISLNYGNEADLVALVGAGKEQFMIASGEQVLLSRAQGLPVVNVWSWYRDYPVGIASMKTDDIQSIQDLKGKVIGLPGLYGASYIGFMALARHGGLQETDYSLRSIGFTQVESLVSSQVDAVVVYLANEPVQLRAKGYEINVLRVADAISLVGNGLVTNEKSIQKDHDLVRKVVSALQKGLLSTVENPDEAFELSQKYVENLTGEQAGIQRQVLNESIKLWQTSPKDPETSLRWEHMQEVLLDLGLLSEPLDLKGAWSDAFVQ